MCKGSKEVEREWPIAPAGVAPHKNAGRGLKQVRRGVRTVRISVANSLAGWSPPRARLRSPTATVSTSKDARVTLGGLLERETERRCALLPGARDL
jgi:hypothetical protein